MSVRITRLYVKGLFNKYNYTLDLNKSYDIAVLIGKNGCGKTSILNILYFMFNPTPDGLKQILNIPFEVFTCQLSNGIRLKLKPGKEKLTFSFDFPESLEKSCNDEQIVITPKTFEKPNDKIKKIRNLIEGHVNYIRANRLFDVNETGNFEDSTLTINRKILDKFKQIYEKYNDIQSKAKDEIVDRFLKTENDIHPTYKSVNEEWEEYIKDVKNFRDLGLIDSTYKLTNEMLKNADEARLSFMHIYINEFKKTLEPVKDFYDRLKIFTDILNERNKTTDKIFSFEKDKGITLKMDKKQLPVQCMSSGEKNDFVMFYNLIFDSEDGGLVLIDEPEISLHIEWQETFLDKMFEICGMNKLQVIIATHSPHILNERFELLIKKENEK